ncbi:MAG: carboxypeptidase regulatory-like domain-containing protein [Actinomycetota bacterium]
MRATRAWIAVTLVAMALSVTAPASAVGRGVVSGVVTDADGVPLAEVCVEAYAEEYEYLVDGSTDESGTYSLNVPAGTYRIHFHDCGWPVRFLAEWFDDKPDFESADAVEVSEGEEVAGVNAIVSTVGMISGTVTDGIEDPIEGICVTAVDASGEWFGATETQSDGTYAVGGLPPGAYGIHFHNCGGSGRFLEEWYDDKPDFESADLVEVSEGDKVADVNAVLAEGGTISGTVTDTRGDPIEGVCVEVVDDDGSWTAWASTAEDGSYSAGGLQSGQFKVHFSDCFARVLPPQEGSDYSPDVVVPGRGVGEHIPEWYDDKPDVDQADPVRVTQGEEVPGIDAVLTIAGMIRGTVTDPQGWPAESVCVEAHDARTGAWGGSGYTWDEGAYTIYGLAPGIYKVKFSDCGGKRRYRTEWFDDQRTEATAHDVVVREAADVGGVDAELEFLPVPDPAITGLTVQSVPVQTDLGPLVPLGTQRTVGVAVSNLGTKATLARLVVWATTPSDGATQMIGFAKVAVTPGESVRRSFDWNATGTVGDATVHARLCSPADVNLSNNHRSAAAYSVAGGTGMGFRMGQPDRIEGCGDAGPVPYPSPKPPPEPQAEPTPL